MRVAVTRSAEHADELVEALRARGHEPVRCPLIRIEPLGDEPLEVGSYDWVVVTSRHGAAELARRRSGAPARIAAIGPGTAEELETQGLRADLVPQTSTQEGLLEAIPQPSGRVLFAAAEDARRVLVHGLDAEFVPLYRTVLLGPAEPNAELVVLASASAARAMDQAGWGLPAVSIGPQTTAEARRCGIVVLSEARTHDLSGLLAAVDEAAADQAALGSAP